MSNGDSIGCHFFYCYFKYDILQMHSETDPYVNNFPANIPHLNSVSWFSLKDIQSLKYKASTVFESQVH